jgi:hypothetical protein
MMAATVVPKAFPLPWPSAGLRRCDDTKALWQKLVVLGLRSTFDEPSGGVADFFGAAREPKHLASSSAAQTALAENYVGPPF